MMMMITRFSTHLKESSYNPSEYQFYLGSTFQQVTSIILTDIRGRQSDSLVLHKKLVWRYLSSIHQMTRITHLVISSAGLVLTGTVMALSKHVEMQLTSSLTFKFYW